MEISDNQDEDSGSQIRDGIIKGCRLSVFLRPNHETLATNEAEYDENVSLPFVYFEQNCFSGLSRPGHLLLAETKEFETISFCYTNALPVYTICYQKLIKPGEGKIGCKILSQSTYREVSFRLSKPATLVAEVTEEKFKDYGVNASIRDGKSHSIVILFDDDRLWSVPLDILYDYRPHGSLTGRSESYVTAYHNLVPKRFAEWAKTSSSGAVDPFLNPRFEFDEFMQMALTYLKVDVSGNAWTIDEEVKNRPSKYEWLKIFAT